MTYQAALDFYIDEMTKPHGAAFTKAVGIYQEGFLRDKVTRDVNEAFRRAVDTAKRILPAIIIKAGV
jgi:acyl-CoA synthetase (NDP forming)